MADKSSNSAIAKTKSLALFPSKNDKKYKPITIIRGKINKPRKFKYIKPMNINEKKTEEVDLITAIWKIIRRTSNI